MSMKVSVYVGAYAECTGRPLELGVADIGEEVDGQLFRTPLRGEHDIWIPNRKIVDREDTFDRESDEQALHLVRSIESEMMAFSVACDEGLQVLQRHYGDVELRWGVVVYSN